MALDIADPNGRKCRPTDAASIVAEHAGHSSAHWAGPMDGVISGVSGLDVRWLGDGDFPVGGQAGVAGDAEGCRSAGRAVRPDLDGAYHRAVSARRGLWRVNLWLAGGSFRTGASE